MVRKYVISAASALAAFWSGPSLAQTAATAAAMAGAPTFIAPPNATIASSVVVPHTCATVYLSGLAAWGPGETSLAGLNTEDQTFGTIDKIKSELAKLGLGLGDVVMMRTYLVADPKLGKMDFAGYSRGYQRQFLDGPVRATPARATVEVAHLAFDGMLVEIEVIAAARCGVSR